MRRKPDPRVPVPTTPGGSLMSKLQKMDAESGPKDKIKYVEKAGQSILSKLFSKDPCKIGCGREDCIICTRERKMQRKEFSYS